MATQTRGGNGRYIRTIKTTRRDFDAAELRAKGWSFERIAAELGFSSRGHAHNAVTRALCDTPYDGADEDKLLDLLRIDRLIEHAWGVMQREHITVSNGRIVGKRIGWERDEATGDILRDGEGAPIPVFEDIPDDAPGMTAVAELRKLIERRAKVIGYDAPARSRVEVITEDAVDAEMAEIARQIALNDARTAAVPGTA